MAATEDVAAAEAANNLSGWAYVRAAGLLGQEGGNMNQGARFLLPERLQLCQDIRTA